VQSTLEQARDQGQLADDAEIDVIKRCCSARSCTGSWRAPKQPDA
jgi:hypothetical protein